MSAAGVLSSVVAGERVDDGAVAPNVNPSDLDDVICQVVGGSGEVAAQAVDAARNAQPAWAATSPQMRADILMRVSTEISARSIELGTMLAREEGKTMREGIGEVMRASQIFQYFSGEALRAGGERLPSTRPGVIVDIVRQPVGVVALITPWNFPIAIPAWKIAPALAFGNAVVFKPAELVPSTAHALVEIATCAGVPDGVLNLVLGPGRVIGPALCVDNRIDAISFTGSQAVGHEVLLAASAHLTKVQLEMGGKNPLVIAADADLERAVEVAIDGAFFSTGQRCTASSRLIVDEDVHDEFVERLVARTGSLTVGHALDPATQIGPVVDRRQLDHNLRYLDVARREGSSEVIGGELLERPTRGFYMSPALVLGTTNDQQINRDEVFGPVASVIRVSGYDEALAIANDTPFGLSSGICTSSLKLSEHFLANSEAGIVTINLPTAGVDPHVPFGGWKGSSYGPREQGSYAREFFTRTKTGYRYPGEV